jgi:serralysin
MALATTTRKSDFVHRAGDGLIGPRGSNDVLASTRGADTLDGLAGDDTIYGDNGNDLIRGGTGDDRMIGGNGDDRYLVQNANDQVIEAANGGTDTVQSQITYTLGRHVENLTLIEARNISGTGNGAANVLKGNAGNNSLTGLGGADLLFGGAGVDKLFGGSGADSLRGGLGNDSLDGGSGTDNLDGGDGNDRYVVDNAGDVVTETLNAGIDTVQTTLLAYTLGDNVENLTFTGTGNFSGVGNALANQIEGGAGNDTLDGAVGADTMIGGIGNDTYIVDNPADAVTEGAGAGTDTVQTTLASYTLGANVENLTFTGTGNFAGTGNAAANLITGGAGDNTLDGAAGADTMIGGVGNDTYIVDDAGDVVTEGAAGGANTVDNVETTLASYTLTANVEDLNYTGTGDFTGTGNEGANQIVGGVGDDTLNGLVGADSIFGGGGDDSIDGGIGADLMSGEAGDDTFIVDDAGDTVQELAGEGTDTVQTTLATYTLAAHLENLTFTGTGNFAGTGNAVANTITGGSGLNLLIGGAGDDTLIGGTSFDQLRGDDGADALTGGSGADSFIFSSLVGIDTVTDFASDTDTLLIDMSEIAVGNQDTTVDNGVTIGAVTLWDSNNEVVVATSALGSLGASDVAAYLSATSDVVTAGDTVIFVVNDGTDSAIYRYTSSGSNTVVVSELEQIALLEGAASVALTDIQFLA